MTRSCPADPSRLARAASALGGSLLVFAAPAARAEGLPHGRAGDCFEKVRIAPTYKTVETKIPRPPLITYRRIPAEYATATRQVLVRPERTVYETVPAVYKTVQVWKSRPGALHEVRVAAVRRTIVERVMISPEHLEWRRGRSDEGFEDGGPGVSVTPTGEVICRVLVPARYAASRRSVVVVPETSRWVRGPSRKILCYERVLQTPERKIPHDVPAVYKTVTYQKLVKPASRERVETPQPDRIVRRKVEVTPSRSEWRKFACRTPQRPKPLKGERG